MIKIISLLLMTTLLLFSNDIDAKQSKIKEEPRDIWDSKNIWIKTYVNNKNYYTTINNIVKIEQKINYNKKYPKKVESLKRRLEIQKSKLALYERNKSFDSLISSYKFDIPQITIYDYFYKTSQERLFKTIDKLINMKNEFNKAKSLLNRYYKKDKKSISEDDLKYFEEFVENINKTYSNLLESKEELDKKYDEYYHEKLQKHIINLTIIVVFFIAYKLLMFLYLSFERKFYKENSGVFQKLIAIIFYISVFLFIVIRYMEDFIYVITFLSVVAAALTIALREVILNIVASVYIFFSNMIKVGDRVMVQFETKHTIGDILDISLMKIKLNEIEDYSNLKEIKNVGRTIYIPNSYVFTKVFYNYSRKKNGLINDLLEFEFSVDNDFDKIQKLTDELLTHLEINHTVNFTLNNTKTGVIGLISYQTNYKTVSKVRGELSIKLLQMYNLNEDIKLKTAKASSKSAGENSVQKKE